MKPMQRFAFFGLVFTCSLSLYAGGMERSGPAYTRALGEAIPRACDALREIKYGDNAAYHLSLIQSQDPQEMAGYLDFHLNRLANETQKIAIFAFDGWPLQVQIEEMVEAHKMVALLQASLGHLTERSILTKMDVAKAQVIARLIGFKGAKAAKEIDEATQEWVRGKIPESLGNAQGPVVAGETGAKQIPEAGRLKISVGSSDDKRLDKLIPVHVVPDDTPLDLMGYFSPEDVASIKAGMVALKDSLEQASGRPLQSKRSMAKRLIKRLGQAKRHAPRQLASVADEMIAAIKHLEDAAPGKTEFESDVRFVLNQMSAAADEPAKVARFIKILRKTRTVQYDLIHDGFFTKAYRRSGGPTTIIASDGNKGPFNERMAQPGASPSVVYNLFGHFVDDMIGGITEDGLGEGWGDLVALAYSGEMKLAIGDVTAYVNQTPDYFWRTKMSLGETVIKRLQQAKEARSVVLQVPSGMIFHKLVEERTLSRAFDGIMIELISTVQHLQAVSPGKNDFKSEINQLMEQLGAATKEADQVKAVIKALNIARSVRYRLTYRGFFWNQYERATATDSK